MTWTDLAVGVAIAVGLVGIVVPVLPGTLLIAAAILVWAVATGGATAWTVFGVAFAVLVVGTVVKYLVPGRQLKATVPTSTMLAGAALGVAGFFVIPVVGLFLGFVLGIYAAEIGRVGRDRAWPSTKAALKAVGVSILIEMVAGVVAAGVWLVGVLVA